MGVAPVGQDGLVGLGDDERTVVLVSLEDDGDPQLAELRGALMRDFEQRTRD
jgi:hypothetical protein